MTKYSGPQSGETIALFYEAYCASNRDPLLTARTLNVSDATVYNYKNNFFYLSEEALLRKLREKQITITKEQRERIRKAKQIPYKPETVLNARERQLIREKQLENLKANHIISTQSITDIINNKLELPTHPITGANLADFIEAFPYFAQVIKYDEGKKEYVASELSLNERLESVNPRALSLVVKQRVYGERFEEPKERMWLRGYQEIPAEMPLSIKKAILTLDKLIKSETEGNLDELEDFREQWADLYDRWEPYLHGTDQEALLKEANTKVKRLGKKTHVKENKNLKDKLAYFSV